MSAAQQSGNPPGYPTQWEADVLLTDGRVARLRPIKPSDANLLVEFYDRVSPESKYLRFFAPYPRLSQRDVQRFTEVDYVDRVAFILTLGELMIGVGRYDRIENDQAEVAFLIEDAHQGRGIAQLLLEHLAEAARERGITKFIAEVLPENRRMAQVFADAGYRVSKDVEDGVLSVEFPILPTDTSVGVMERREHRAEAASMRRLLTPERVVVLGRGKRVQGLVNSLLSGGFRGEVIAVSTDATAVSGVRTATSIATIEGSIDLVLVSIPTNELGAVVIDAAHKGATAMVVLTGTDSTQDNRTVVSLARAYGVRALGPDALGLINTDPAVGLNASPGPMPRTGGVGLFCQSAAVGVALINRALRQQIGLSSFISSGAYADVTGNDVMQFWQDDGATRACLLTLDSLGNPRKFFRIIRQLTRTKPVVVFAPGQARRSSHIGVRGGLGHAPEQAVDALFRQAGVIVVHRRGAMFDIAKIAARQPLPAGPRVRVIANSATLVQQLTHTVTAVGLLAGGDPVVLPGDAGPERYAEATRAALADDGCDAVVCAAVAIFDSGTDAIHGALAELAAEAKKPLVGVLIDFHEHSDLDDGGDDDKPGGLPTFDAPADAVQALSALSAYAHWRERDPGAVPLLDVDELAAKRVVNRVLSRDRAGRELTGPEATALLSTYGISLVPRHRVKSLDQATEVAARLGWDVVLKARSKAVRGRPDLAGVYRNLDTPEALRDAWAELGELTAELGLGGDPVVADPVIQAMAPPGVPLIMTSREDAAFGPMLSLGLDGIASELLGDTVYRVPPLTTADAAAMVRDLRAAPTLFGRDGTQAVDVTAVQDLLHRLAQLADDVPQLASVRLSPVIASVTGVHVLGARVLIAPTSDQRDPMARTL
ncbi:GNAT family N-acetyltransferase [Microlunatus sp. GCM10028923]|uniref:bifunctional acetate--CoA ligase family protein/GNAT family N-acetyltransferase n=1 Tax=Microlunatus sp. GCM10028923 TaxID=3273400 RepID=UPI0036134A4D